MILWMQKVTKSTSFRKNINMSFVPHTPEELQSMLQAVGLACTEDLF